VAKQSLRFTESIGLKVTVEQYDALRRLAEAENKSIAEWCRDALVVFTSLGFSSPDHFGLMAEITATQAILIDLLCAIGREGRITTQRAQQIVDAAHNRKYSEALDLFQVARSKASKFRLTRAAHREKTGEVQHDE
jgi:hypothetical protein